MTAYRYLLVVLAICCLTPIFTQTSLGQIIDNTNEALPDAYNFQEYVFAEPDDQGDCTGATNPTADIEEVFFAQTHRHTIDHPFFFTIGHRPLLLQVAVTGSGAAPDVQVSGSLNGEDLGMLCLAGPDELSESIDLDSPNFSDFYTVTLPKSWVQDGLELIITTGGNARFISADDLKIGPYTEMNLVMVNMDVMDYNSNAHLWPIFDDFLQEVASAIPASVVRFGIFPANLTYPELVTANDQEQLLRLTSRSELPGYGIDDGFINSQAVRALGNLHRSTGDYLSTVYFGNTLNLSPGGWGGGKSFVSFDFTDIFIHELGHALSLPHWGSFYGGNPNNIYEFLYPYGGETGNGGGRGTSWNFIQDTYEFASPVCTDDNGQLIGERSDCMQRNNACQEERPSGSGPWDGFGDFSAMAMHRYLIGAEAMTGQVEDRDELKDYQFNKQFGFPIMTLEGGQRVYERDPLQAQEITFEENFDLPGEEQLNQDVYLVYGTAHAAQPQANIVYKPVRYTGTLPPIVDPTDPATFDELLGDTYRPYLYETRDILVRLTYTDGSVLHAINPFHSYSREVNPDYLGIWRGDMCHWSLVVPGDKELLKVEQFNRPFCVRFPDQEVAGNINYAPYGITAENFMDEAVYQAEYEFGAPQVLGSNTIGNLVWHDHNQDGDQDDDEPGIPGVSLVLWEDGDGDEIPDWMGFRGVAITDSTGHYSFSGLSPGNYLVFVWSVDNWEEGEPLFGMKPTDLFEPDPNTDLFFDNNGHPGNIEPWFLTSRDIVSGMITLTADGEPLNDGDREDCWFDFDPSGNMTIDFGFYVDGAPSAVVEAAKQPILVYPNPVAQTLFIKTPEPIDFHAELLDGQGRSLLKAALTGVDNQIDMSGLPAGIYQLVISDQTGSLLQTKRVVKSGRF